MFLNVRKRGQLANQSQKFQIAKSETDWFLIKNVSINYLITRNQNCSFVSNSTSKYTYKIAVIFRFRLLLHIYTKSTSILPALKYTSPSKPQFELNAVIGNHIPLTKSLKKKWIAIAPQTYNNKDKVSIATLTVDYPIISQKCAENLSQSQTSQPKLSKFK